MLRFSMERIGGGDPSGFDLGEMCFSCGDVYISSKAEKRLRMMIYLSAVGLIDSLLAVRLNKRAYFSAVDSSFSILFTLNKDGVCIESNLGIMGPFSLFEVLASVEAGVSDFIDDGAGLSDRDSVYADFNGAINDLRDEVRRCQG